MKSVILLALAFCIANISTAQKTVLLNIEHKLGDKTFTTQDLGSNDKGNDFTVERMQYYLSQLAIVHDNGKITKAKDVYLLVDAKDSKNHELGSYDVTSIEGVQFSVGVNTPENNADPALWPKDHPLAPKSPEMHWGWAAGYRFVAMEGKTDEMLASTYEIHALGNANYFDVEIKTEATVNGDTLTIKIVADYAKALTSIDIAGGSVTHGEMGDAVTLLQNFRDHVFTSTDGKGNSLDVKNEASPISLGLYPNPSANGQFELFINHSTPTTFQVMITDALGKTIQSLQIENNVDYAISLNEKGLFIITVANEQGFIKSEKLLVK